VIFCALGAALRILTHQQKHRKSDIQLLGCMWPPRQSNCLTHLIDQGVADGCRALKRAGP
jgi:hypothetical protein